jgi:2-dehydro-3-deoxyphosphogluconate aldolase/(4S)-4-hydroxy-2-oxoglutarate aldolase
MIASGGVNQQTAGDFILAGADALGIGRDLIHQDAIKRRERGWIQELARRYVRIVSQARSELK